MFLFGLWTTSNYDDGNGNFKWASLTALNNMISLTIVSLFLLALGRSQLINITVSILESIRYSDHYLYFIVYQQQCVYLLSQVIISTFHHAMVGKSLLFRMFFVSDLFHNFFTSNMAPVGCSFNYQFFSFFLWLLLQCWLTLYGILDQSQTQLLCYYRDKKLAHLRPLRLFIFSY